MEETLGFFGQVMMAELQQPMAAGCGLCSQSETRRLSIDERCDSMWCVARVVIGWQSRPWCGGRVVRRAAAADRVGVLCCRLWRVWRRQKFE